jgi:hypothetical protein
MWPFNSMPSRAIGGAPFVGELSSTPSNADTYAGSPASRPAEDYTVRITPAVTERRFPPSFR